MKIEKPNFFIDHFKNLGFDRLFLGCSSDPQTRSYGFYRHLGWKSTGTIDQHQDEILEYFLPPNFVGEIVPATQEETVFVDSKLFEFNKDRLPFTQKEDLVLQNYLVKDGEKIVAGIEAEVYWKMLYIGVLWVDENYRNKKYGSALLSKVESEAKTMGATLANLFTYDFQAKDFYLKHGYEIFSVLEDCPVGHRRFYMKKAL